jgi:transposase
MIKRIHGIDRHKRYSTICVYNLEGEEIKLITRHADLKEYIKSLDEHDAVILEAGNGTFHYADLIEKQGAKVYILNPRKFKIIKDSWQKTDKIDARNMAEALWIAIISKKIRLPLVYKPSYQIRELRRMFTQYQFINRHMVSVKNMIQACLSDVGIVLTEKHKKLLFTPEKGYEFFTYVDVNEATRVVVKSNLEILYILLKQKENLFEQIMKFGEFLKEDVKLLIEIKGVSPLLALVFLAEIGGDVSRFKKVKEMNAYLGVVPGIYQSGKKKKRGRIIKASRHLARTLFTQAVIHLVNASESITHFYESLKKRKSAGKSRIAVIRKVFGIMRSMLIKKEHFWHINEKCYVAKLNNYERILRKLKKSA